MTTRRLLICSYGRVVAGCAVLLKSADLSGAPAGWEIQFKKVRDLLKLKVDGPNGPVIKFKERGNENYTWTDADPPEIKDLSQWFKATEPKIVLHAELSKRPDGVGERQCEMVIRYGGKDIAGWPMNAVKEETKTFVRKPE